VVAFPLKIYYFHKIIHITLLLRSECLSKADQRLPLKATLMVTGVPKFLCIFTSSREVNQS